MPKELHTLEQQSTLICSQVELMLGQTSKDGIQSFPMLFNSFAEDQDIIQVDHNATI